MERLEGLKMAFRRFGRFCVVVGSAESRVHGAFGRSSAVSRQEGKRLFLLDEVAGCFLA